MATMLSDATIVAVARRHLRAGRVHEAEILTEEWHAHHPGSAALQVLQGWLCLVSGRRDDARQLVENAVQVAPHLAFAYVALGVLHAADGQQEEAELCWERALVLDPADSDASAFLVQLRCRTGDRIAAEQLARQALVACPRDAMAHFILVETLLARSDGVEEALRLVASGVALEPDEWRGWFVYGRVLAHAGQLPEAHAKFERALLVRPDEPEVLKALASVCLQQTLWAEAERLAKKMMVLSPRQIHGYRILANAQAAQNRTDDALGVLLHALRVMPDDLGALMDLAGLHRRSGRLEEAATVARQAQAIFPGVVAPAYFMADLDLYRGNTSAAFEVLAKLELAKPRTVNNARLPDQDFSIAGCTVVLTGESVSQVLLLARYAPRLVALGADVYLNCGQEMQWGGLAGHLTGVTALIERLTDAPENALVEPIICLPARFGIQGDKPVWGGAYLEVAAHHVAQVRVALADKPRPWVGIELNGMADPSVLPAIMRAIRAAGGTAVVLGSGIDPATVGEPTVWPRIPDLYVFAAWVKALDSMISADGVTSSVSGPLGTSAHILLGTDCDSLWGVDSDRTPWFPHLRLYRQSLTAGWGEALHALHDDIVLLVPIAPADLVEIST